MYALYTHVWSPSHERDGHIVARRFDSIDPQHRRVLYDVAWHDGGGGLRNVHGTALRRADYVCDGCGRWRSGRPHGRGTHGSGIAFCFLCCEASYSDVHSVGSHPDLWA